MDYLCIILIVVGFKKAFCDYHCTMESFEVTCTGLTNNELSQDVSVTLNKPDIVSLSLTDGILPTISKSSFQDFTDLETLYVTNCRVSSIETDSFSHFENLKNLYLGHNNLTDFNVHSLSEENQLILLDLSNNRLKNLSDFELSYFSKLNVLNLANNFISYLPRNVVQKLEEQNNFYLVVDNNPWDCNNLNWVDYLTPKLREGFCPNKTHTGTVETSSESNSQVLETTISSQDDGLQRIVEDEESIANPNDREERKIRRKYQPKPTCSNCGLYYCISWFAGGIWLGIIVGNLPKIIAMLWTTPKTYSDQSTQCEQQISDQYMISGYHIDFGNRKIQPKTSKS